MKEHAEAVSCIILAGGEGKRVAGSDKGLLDYQGKPLIEHVISTVKKQVNDIVISANRNLNTYKKYSDCVISDSASDYHGPLAGIAACLPHCRQQQVLVVACDMPALPGDLVKRLEQNKSAHAISIASIGKHHQMALLVDKNQSTIIQQRLDDKKLSLIQWVESVSHVSVNFDERADAFLNLNHLPEIRNKRS